MRRAIRWEEAHPKQTQAAERQVGRAGGRRQRGRSGTPAEIGPGRPPRRTSRSWRSTPRCCRPARCMFFSYPTVPERQNSAAGVPLGSRPPARPQGLVDEGPAGVTKAGQHLVRRPDLHRRRRAAGVRRQPRLEGRPTAWKGLEPASTRSTRSARPGTSSRDMAHGRWYPTGVRMADGRIADHQRAGRDRRRPSMDEDVELFTPSADIGGVGAINLIGKTERHREARRATGGYYPHMFAMPDGDGRSSSARSTHQTWFMDHSAREPSAGRSPNMTRAASGARRCRCRAAPAARPRSWRSAAARADGDASAPTRPPRSSTRPTRARAGRRPADEHRPRPREHACCCRTARWSRSGGGVGRDNTYGSPLHAARRSRGRSELWDPADRRLAARPGPGREARLPLDRAAAARRPRDVGR